MRLNAKQSAFCNEYLVDFNATQAAIRAGYAKRTANRTGPRLLSNVVVQGKVLNWWQSGRVRAGRRLSGIIRELCAIAFTRLTDIVYIDEDGLAK